MCVCILYHCVTKCGKTFWMIFLGVADPNSLKTNQNTVITTPINRGLLRLWSEISFSLSLFPKTLNYQSCFCSTSLWCCKKETFYEATCAWLSKQIKPFLSSLGGVLFYCSFSHKMNVKYSTLRKFMTQKLYWYFKCFINKIWFDDANWRSNVYISSLLILSSSSLQRAKVYYILSVDFTKRCCSWLFKSGKRHRLACFFN